MATTSASVTAPLLQQIIPTRFSTRTQHARKLKHSLSLNSPLHQSSTFPPISTKFTRSNYISSSVSRAYVTGPPILSESDPRIDDTDPDTDKAEASNLISRKLLWSLLARHKLRLGLSVLALVGGTTCTLSMPIFSGRFFEVLIGARPEPLWKLLSKVGLLYSLEPIFTVIFVVNMNTVWEKVMSTLRAQIFRRILIQKAEFFDRYKVGELSGLLTSDLGSLKDVVSENISRDRGFRALSEVVGTICILFALSPQLAPILGLLVLFVSVSVATYKRSTVPVFKAHGMAQASMSDCVTETFSAIRTVRSFSGEKRQMLMFGSQVLAYQKSGIKLGNFKSINESLTRVAVYISLLALYCLGGSKVKAGELSVGTVASFIGYTFTLTFAVQGLVNTFGDLRGTFASVERINSVISGAEIDEALAYGLEKEIQKKEVNDENIKLFISNGAFGKSQQLDSHYMSALKSTSDVGRLAWSGDVALEDVHFSYPLRPDVEILNGLNLTLKCGTVTALVGSSGAGKSTIVQLLARFYEPTRGRITVSGEDLRTFDKSEWARVVSIVNQEPVLFSVSVGENIAYGLPDDIVSKDDIIKAAKAANAHEFIISLPQGYDTLVGERGGLLSGGQRQRIAIARALLKNAPILILDEATSALDAVSERLVQDALNHLMKGRTTLVIAHRLSTVQNAHQIALCSNGQIAELGSHMELVARKGQYASLVDTQRLAFE
ncbi:ARABIDOPSIS THALIANA NON-INTRINSIC ABC PROTEIN 8, non-intrinsic ABC protein 8 [Hibiscus trionum]|uniref:ARABIDOPSIS THALIANA NON-INTRINSIC ABC PROTEIN 8, non-intrinsic ABC protein 8 n=1 Tax=Hibiscus trionum TaxID=183268 RepID=A0A9W7MC58_HIBTR|nr:ARABIDOPSIS THALIANA NON-INTRINSIC ABC PROTEIN 8, non-intrinsic ABC protein 8 [Hibiscus trionum]